jgi:limonene-1,2-epoxide hydrolase
MVDITYYDLEKGSIATPFSIFFWAMMDKDWTTAEAQLADDIEMDLPNNQIRKGKNDVITLIKDSKKSYQEDPVPILNTAFKEWGIWEYWNIGTTNENIIEFGKKAGLPILTDVNSIGKKYKVQICFIYHINAMGKIDLIREYVDVESTMAQFK